MPRPLTLPEKLTVGWLEDCKRYALDHSQWQDDGQARLVEYLCVALRKACDEREQLAAALEGIMEQLNVDVEVRP